MNTLNHFLRIRHLVALSLLLFMAGCSIEPVQNYSKRSITNENRGYVVLSLGPANILNRGMVHYNVHLREKPDGEPISVLFTRGELFVQSTPVDFSQGQLVGSVYVIELPAGNYEVTGYRFFRPNTYSPPVSIPFTVVPGQVTYIGRFMVGYRQISKALLADATHTDAYDEDMAIARRKYPSAFPENTTVRREFRD